MTPSFSGRVARGARIAMLSVHTCPLAALGGKETGGMNVYVREVARALGRLGFGIDVFTRSQDPAIPEVVEPPPPTPCPNDPSKMTPNCGPAVVQPPPVEIKKVEARIVGHQVAASGGVIITVDKGKAVGVDKGWKGHVVSSSGSALASAAYRSSPAT